MQPGPIINKLIIVNVISISLMLKQWRNRKVTILQKVRLLTLVLYNTCTMDTVSRVVIDQLHRLMISLIIPNKGNNKITEIRTVLQRENQNS